MIKTCKRCDAPISPGGTFCSTYCSAKYNNEQRTARTLRQCQQCGADTYNAKYCSLTCVGLGNRKPVVTRKGGKKVKKPYARIRKTTDEEIAQIISTQDGRCAVCQKVPKRWVKDHCHDTGELRGMLCWSCNTGIGALGDTSTGLIRAVDYLRANENKFKHT